MRPIRPLPLAAALVCACAQQSPSIATDELVVRFVAVQADTDPIAVRAEFRAGPERPCEALAPDDRLAAATDGEPVALSADAECEDGGPAYAAAIGGGRAAEEVVVSLERSGSFAPLETPVALAPAFDIAVSAQTASRAEPLLVSWPPSPAVQAAVLTAEGDCLLGGFQAPIGADFDFGAITVPAGAIQVRPDVAPDTSCPLTLRLTLLHGGDPHPGFAGGDTEGQRVRTAVITSAP